MIVNRGGSLLLYINGVLSGSASITEFDHQDLSNGYRFYVGQHESGILRWHGLVDDLRVYRRALSDSDIDRLFNSSSEAPGILYDKNSETSPGSSGTLSQNYPNPFRSETLIPVNLSKATRARLSVHNVMGQEVALLLEGIMDPGLHEIPWRGLDHRGKPVNS
jgi:hypothetical protein